MRRVPCPIPGYTDIAPDGEPIYWIGLPDEWLGEHAKRRDDTLTKSLESGLPGTLLNFAVAIGLCDDWNLPGTSGNREAWDLEKLSLSVIGWVTTVVLPEYNACFYVKKNYSIQSTNGQVKTMPPDQALGNSIVME